MKKQYKKTKNLFLLVVILQLFTNCNYEFSEDYYKEINQSFPIITSVSLEDFQNNITIYSPLNVVYNYDGNNKHRLYKVSIFIDNNIIMSSSDISNEFYIDTDKLSEGNHVLKIEYLFSSGTGSLADVNNLEAYIATENYNFTIDKSPPNAVVISSAEIVDGTIYINWEPITSNFDSAELSITSPYNVNEKIQLSKDDLSKQTYNDQVNSDNNLRYSIKLTNRYAVSISNEVEVSFEQIKATKEIINDEQYKLTWTKHPLYKNIDYFTCNLTYIQGQPLPELSPLGGEYIINKAPIFADTLYDNFYFSSHKNLPGYTGYTITSTIGVNAQFGKKFDVTYCRDYFYNPAENLYYAVKTNSNYSLGYQLVKLESEDLSEVSSGYFTTGTAIEYYYNIIIEPVSSDILIDLRSKSFLIDKSTLQVIAEWKAIDYGVTETYISTHYRNNNLFIVNYSTNELSIFDVDSKKLIYNAEYNYLFKASDDGRYFYNNDGVYELNNGAVNLVASTNTGLSVKSFEFLTNQNKCIYRYNDDHPVILDLNSKVKTTLNDISHIDDIIYDVTTNKVFFGQYHSFIVGSDLSFVYILDLDSNEMKSLQVYDTHYSGQFYTYSNGKIIFSKGLFLDY